MDVNVYWKARLVARLRNYEVDYYKIFGEWIPAGDPAFDRHLRALQNRIAPDGSAMLAVTLEIPDATAPQPARVYVNPLDVVPYGYRFGEPGEEDRIIQEPTKAKDCPRCGRPIPLDRLRAFPKATRCLECQLAVEKAV
jgi:hypothetical protein